MTQFYFYAWIIGWPLAGIVAGVIGMRARLVRQFLVWPPAVYSIALFMYGLFRGGPNECVENSAGTAYTCHPTAFFADVDGFAIAVIVIVSVLSFAPIASASTHSRTYSLVAAGFLVLLILLFLLGLTPWIPAASAVLAAAVAGPPGAVERTRGSC